MREETDFNGRRNGALTHFLAQALGSDGDFTLKSAFDDQAAAEVRQAVDEQDPVLEGPSSRLNATPF